MSNSTKAPNYVALAQKITAELRAMGITLVEQKTVVDGVPGNKNWAAWQHAETGHKIYLHRTAEGKGIIHTTIEMDSQTPGVLDHTKNGKDLRPGKIETFFAASEQAVTEHLLPKFAGLKERLRESKRPASKAASEQPQSLCTEDPRWDNVVSMDGGLE